MNYDHRFHAGNFADVFKHVVLTRILLYLRRKPAPFRVIDTHAGRGLYDLAAESAARTQEWRSGVGRLDAAALSPAEVDLIAPYLEIVGAAATARASYPGSPVIAQRLCRPSDRMIFCELHPAAFAALEGCVARDRRAKAVAIDGYTGLRAYIPPVERRGLVLVDPPFEAPDEFDRLAEALAAAHAKWRQGVLVAWYPVKDRRIVDLFANRVAAAAPDLLRLEFEIGAPNAEGRLAGTGMLVVNPPFTLEAEMKVVLPALRRQLGGEGGGWRMDRRGDR